MSRKHGKRKLIKAARVRALVIARAKGEAATRICAVGTFRPAIAHDGALLLTGAEQPGELNRSETRTLALFLLRLNETGGRA